MTRLGRVRDWATASNAGRLSLAVRSIRGGIKTLQGWSSPQVRHVLAGALRGDCMSPLTTGTTALRSLQWT